MPTGHVSPSSHSAGRPEQDGPDISFASLGLGAALVANLPKAGLTIPTSIQTRAIPALLSGQDAEIIAPTGTGKTASYLLPLLEQLNRKKNPTALVIVPTRELARQVAAMGRKLAPSPDLAPFAVYGGAHQTDPRASRPAPVTDSPTDQGVPPAGTRVVVATPGRLLDLLRSEQLDLTPCRHLVLDEGDRLMSNEFREEMDGIRALLPPHRQTILVSATLSGDSEQVARAFLHKPVHIEPAADSKPSVRQALLFVETAGKPAAAEALLRRHPDRSAIVFVTTREEADLLHHYLRKKRFKAVVLHGRLSQPTRNAAIDAFQQGKATILVATDIAARGLDVEQVGQVINMSPPDQPETYQHRIGRTGRAGRQGWAATLCSAAERKTMRQIEARLGLKLAILTLPLASRAETPRTESRR